MVLALLIASLLVTDVDARPASPAAVRAPSLVVLKSRRELQLLRGGTIVRTYHVALGLDPVTSKERQGDFATPEGVYYICRKNPQSRFDRSLAISYPGPNDAQRGLEEGLISEQERNRIIEAWVLRTPPPANTRLGGEICIHGKGSTYDWTDGCVALDYLDIEELYRAVPVGTPVEIRP